ncbi:nicotinamide-nucleotide amidase [Franconibacter helveticus]|uniref:nicotinamide-nucleotide amidase n=1 Tax=Franconibacter helveticus TaxID=357240 RepID=UPI00290A1DBB|nr:nicotinamide-nucleotide amidase [Franconibacter helveticus]MDU6924947.1 nicotinamide-nucleotide amidase [Franconibacter helveticus]
MFTIGADMNDREMMQLSQQLGETLRQLGATVTTAESCTGGWIAKAITDIAGSSAWFERGFVTYSNEAKQQMIGVDGATLEAHGAVSEPVVRQMAQGALNAAAATWAVSVSGIAGPDGGSAQKPVGTVWFGIANSQGEVRAYLQNFSGDREAVRRQATVFALEILWQNIRQKA